MDASLVSRESRMPKLNSTLMILVLCCGCTTGRGDKTDAIAGRLGYEGCRVSKPLTMAEVMGKDMSGEYQIGRPHPDWDELISQYVSGDLVYFIDCRRVDPTRIVVGISLYALVRGGVIVARAADTIPG
jgi:hypothetical protein